jgi:outer membrane protein OmpA-like peptidoglycan-associated protein
MGCNPAMAIRSRSLGASGLALALAACALPQSAPPPVPPPVSAAPLPVAPTSAWAWSPQLESAGARLRSALWGSGAEVSRTSDQRLWIALPGEASFPAGRSAVSPAAGAWLDQVAASLRSLPRAEVQIVGPADKHGGGQTLAVDRAASARDWMVMRGVAARRMAVSGAVPAGRGTAVDGRLHILVGERGTP